MSVAKDGIHISTFLGNLSEEIGRLAEDLRYFEVEVCCISDKLGKSLSAVESLQSLDITIQVMQDIGALLRFASNASWCGRCMSLSGVDCVPNLERMRHVVSGSSVISNGGGISLCSEYF